MEILVALKNYIEHVTVELKKNTLLENWMYISTDILSEYSASADIFTTIVYKSSYVYTVAFGETLLCCYVEQVNSCNAGYNCMFIWIKSGKRSWTQMFIRPQAAPGELTGNYKLYHITLTVGNLMKYAWLPPEFLCSLADCKCFLIVWSLLSSIAFTTASFRE